MKKRVTDLAENKIKEVRSFILERKEKICEMNDFATGTGRNMKSYSKLFFAFEIMGILFFTGALISGAGVAKSLLLLLLWAAGGIVIPYFILKKKCDKKRTDIEIELPEYMDRAAFLLSSGMQLGEALKTAAEGNRGTFSMEVDKALGRRSMSA